MESVIIDITIKICNRLANHLKFLPFRGYDLILVKYRYLDQIRRVFWSNTFFEIYYILISLVALWLATYIFLFRRIKNAYKKGDFLYVRRKIQIWIKKRIYTVECVFYIHLILRQMDYYFLICMYSAINSPTVILLNSLVIFVRKSY